MSYPPKTPSHGDSLEVRIVKAQRSLRIAQDNVEACKERLAALHKKLASTPRLVRGG